MQTPGNSSFFSISPGVCPELPGRRPPALTCSSGRLSPCYVLPAPKVLVSESHHCLLGKRPPRRCSRPPKDALTDAKLCTVEPGCVQENSTLISHHRLPSLQSLTTDAPPHHARAASSSKHQESPMSPGQEPPQLEGLAQPTKNMLKEAKKARCLQPGFCKGNNGACHLNSVCSFTLLTGEVPCSNVQPKTWVKKPTKEAFLGTVTSKCDYHSLWKLALELNQRL